jgi:hypothetical protein
MNPYRHVDTREEPRAPAPSAREDIVITMLVLALGVAGVVIGIAYGRATEAGLGVALAIFGMHAARSLVRGR